jgi:lipid II:glycine glycyltransferase (peptidoglycan interpeptide bridge formation enzyme)
VNLRIVPEDGGQGSSASFLQSSFWGEFKSSFGWKPLRFRIEGPSGDPPSLLVLLRRLPGGLSFAYSPHGPALDLGEIERSAFLAELSEALRPFLPKTCLFIRFDPPWFSVEEATGEEADPSSSLRRVEESRPRVGPPLIRAAADVQPPDTVLVDLTPSEDAMLASMKPKWRYNVKLAEKKGVVVEAAGGEAIPEFYELYQATSRRDRIALHPEAYYRRLFALAEERRRRGDACAPDLRLWFARHEGEGIAAIVTLFLGEEAVYLYGASSDSKRNLMPAYALQWSAMRAAKAAGCRSYDLFGIPPIDDPRHPMAGLYRFKTGFGGRIAHRAGSWDYPLQAVGYSAYRTAERIRAWWFKDFKKRGSS